MNIAIAASYVGGDRASYFLITQQHGRDYIQKIAKVDGSHAAYFTRSAFELKIIKSLSS